MLNSAKLFVMGIMEGIYVSVGLNPQQVIKPQTAGRLVAVFIMFIVRWSIVAVIIVTVYQSYGRLYAYIN